jgi:hypothetical protein
MNAVKTAIPDNFAQVKDPRKHHSPPHSLLEIITLTLCAVIYGADGWVAVEQFGLANESWLRRFLRLPNGIPSHDTLGNVFAAIAPAEFEAAFSHWTRTVSHLSQGQIEPFDAQTPHHSPDGRLGKQAIRMIRAWADQNPVVVDYLKLDPPTETTAALPSSDPLELINDPIMPEARDWLTGASVLPWNDQRGYWFGLEHWRCLFEAGWLPAFSYEPERCDSFAPYLGQPFNDPADSVWPTPQYAGPDLSSLTGVEVQP